ncbi:hypothetical protein ACFE33_14560 [Falsihalocynthiibacter sp. SS001]|uniref:hypothetical protein n=1 Tax=Falsihalocynthiibacter sp. SS001 TaxID=3349698 RepID=UPI0036D36E03
MDTSENYRLRLWAFFLSLILSPLVLVAVSFAVFHFTASHRIGFLITTSISLILLSSAYILIGWPALFFGSRKRKPTMLRWGVVGLIANLPAPFVTFLFDSLFSGQRTMDALKTSFEISYTLGFAAMFTWSAFAALLYRLFTFRRKSTQE